MRYLVEPNRNVAVKYFIVKYFLKIVFDYSLFT